MSEEPKRKLDQLLSAFGEAAGMSGLATEENGVCILVFDGNTRVNLLADPVTRDLLSWSNLGEVPAGQAATTLTRLMQANLFGQGTRGATLGLMPESDEVVLAMRRPLDGTDVEGLRDVIETMVETAEALAALVAGEGPPASANSPAVSPSGVIRG